MSFITLIFMGLLGILMLLMAVRCVFGLVFGFYILTNLIYNTMITVHHRLKQQAHAKHRIIRIPSPEQRDAQQTATVDPNLALAAQCLIWGDCKSRQAQ